METSRKPDSGSGNALHSIKESENHDLAEDSQSMKNTLSDLDTALDSEMEAEIDAADVDRGSMTSGEHHQTVVSFKLDTTQAGALKGDAEARKKQNKKHSGHSRTILISTLYAIMLTMVGITFPVTEAITENWGAHHAGAAFQVYIFTLSIIFLLYMMVYQGRALKLKESRKQQTQDESEGSLLNNKPGDVFMRRSMSDQDTHSFVNKGFEFGDFGPKKTNPILRRNTVSFTNHDSMAHGTPASSAFGGGSTDVYEFIKERSGTATLTNENASFFLRLGTLMFAIANLVFIAFHIGYQYGENFKAECKLRQIGYTVFFHLVFVLIQTYFIFSSTSIVIYKQKRLVRFGVMHVLATNVCVWLRILVKEIMEGIHEAQHESHDAVYAVLPPGNGSGNVTVPCFLADGLFKRASPYLFPFLLEYSLIAMATMAALFESLNVQVSSDLVETVKKALKSAKHSASQAVDHSEAIFSKSHAGMYSGAIFLAATVTCIVLFFWYLQIGLIEIATLSFQIGDLVLRVLLIGAVIIGMVLIDPLNFDMSRDNTIDHVLLVVSFVGLFVQETFEMIASFVYLRSFWDPVITPITAINATSAIVGVIQAILQTSYIMDGMQRFCSKPEDIKKKPGRGIITFLLVANISYWVYKTFQEKRLGLQLEMEFYGPIAWPIILNISLPLQLFYRFHSAICLAHMWHSLYEVQHSPVQFELL